MSADPVHGLRSDDPVVREEACRTLIAQGRKAIPALVLALADPRVHTRREAARALARINDPESAPALVRALEDELPGVRWLACEALVALGEKSLVPLLEALIRQSDSVRLRQGAHHILRALAGSEQGRKHALVLEALEGPEPISALPVAAFNTLKNL